jgi:hypothetical protein
MSAKTFENFESGVESLFSKEESNNFTTKLERRRRIEELEEEKRLLRELCEFA